MSGGTRRTWLVARREVRQRVRSLAFRISTVLSIAIVVALIVIPAILAGDERPTRTVGLVGSTSPTMQPALQLAARPADVIVRTRTFQDAAAAERALRSGDVNVVLIDDRAMEWKAEPDGQLRAIVTSAVQSVSVQRSAAALGLSSGQVTALLQPPALSSKSLEPVTKERSKRVGLATISLVLLLMAISFYGGFLLTGVIEEKSSRVVEVLLSRLRPHELLSGKVLGIGLVGLGQFVLVGISAFAALVAVGSAQAPSTAPGTIAWIVLWFVLGYAFYAVLFASAGSLVSRQEDAQSMTLPVTAVLLVGYVLSFAAVEEPNGAVALVGSFLPPMAPMTMTVRIASGAVPWWQIALAIVVMVVSVIGLLRLAGRIYAGALLRIGRRVKLREAWHGAEG